MRTPESIADEYDVDVTTVRGWIRSGALVAFRRGRVTRVHEDDLERFRRANEWSVEVGAKARSAVARSGATASATTTGEQSFRAGLASIKAERNARSGRGSERTTAKIVPLHGQTA